LSSPVWNRQSQGRYSQRACWPKVASGEIIERVHLSTRSCPACHFVGKKLEAGLNYEISPKRKLRAERSEDALNLCWNPSKTTAEVVATWPIGCHRGGPIGVKARSKRYRARAAKLNPTTPTSDATQQQRAPLRSSTAATLNRVQDQPLFLEQHRLLVCREHRTGIQNVDVHLRSQHAAVAIAERKAIVDYCRPGRQLHRRMASYSCR
jgi:hypothetical protein